MLDVRGTLRSPGRRRPALRIVAGLALALAAGVETAAAAPGAVPEALAARVQERGSLRVIAELAVEAEPEGRLNARARAAQRASIARAQDEALAGLAGSPHRITRRFASIPHLALEVSPAALSALAAHPRIRSVTEDRLERPVLAQSGPRVEANAAWSAGRDGSGQLVAVLDTGSDGSHPMLAGKLAAEACFSGGRDCPNGEQTQIGSGAAAPCDYNADDCAHGTHVAGIAVGDGPSFDGIARGAGLVAIQVFSKFNGPVNCGFSNSPCPLSYLSDQIAGLEHVLSLAAGLPIAAANLSLGGATYSSPCDASETARKAAIDNLRSLGIATVIASGNAGDSTGIGTPACISSAISVGSTTDSDGVSSFSNSASFLSLLAPGSSIESSIPGGGTAVWSGTSMATPHVSGAWAILKQHVPSASVDDVLAALQATGLPVTDDRNGVTTPRIRIHAAANALACFDADADGVCDDDDACPGFDDGLDADSDGLPDGCDPDDDNDGLADVVESLTGSFASASNTGTDPLDPDSDGDHYGDGAEVAAGTDPNDASSHPSRQRVPLLGRAGRLALALALLGGAFGAALRRPRC